VIARHHAGVADTLVVHQDAPAAAAVVQFDEVGADVERDVLRRNAGVGDDDVGGGPAANDVAAQRQVVLHAQGTSGEDTQFPARSGLLNRDAPAGHRGFSLFFLSPLARG
jgi:hypothetical protein